MRIFSEDNPNVADICRRIAQLRTELEGSRGKAPFAKKLGLSPSTYDYYESNRVPPADVLVRIADLAGVDLRWLITGQATTGPVVRSDHPAVLRAAKLLADRPEAAAALSAFLDLIAKSMEFPAKQDVASAQWHARTGHASSNNKDNNTRGETPLGLTARTGVPLVPLPDRAGGDDWIPILGRSAAGLPQFWADGGDAHGLTTLDELVRKNVSRADQAQPAVAQEENNSTQAVAIITLSEPDSGDVVEFIAAPSIKTRYRDSFALRIDGESMSPDIRHGDIVVLSPSAPARDGRPAVVQLRRQIGVTCKLYRLAGDTVHLAAINEQFPSTIVPAREVQWAFRVLARIRK